MSLLNIDSVENPSQNGQSHTGKSILLVNPMSDKNMADKALMCPQLGTIRIAGYLQSKGHYVETVDLNLQYFLEEFTLEEKLQEKEWDIIGFSVLDETLINDIQNMFLAEKIRPNALLVAGGMEAQFNYQTVLDKSPCNIAVLGEGEAPLLMLANGQSPDKIPGIVFKTNAVPLSHEEFWAATDAIPWENIDYEKYWDYYVSKYGDKYNEQAEKEIHTVRIFTKNRCPFGCNYCSSTNQLTWASGKQSVGAVPIIGLNEDDLLGVIDRVLDAHPRVRTIYFTDDDFCVLRHDVISFCKRVVEKGYPERGLSFMCLTRITDLSEEMIIWLKKAGFRNLNIGIETFSENIMEDIEKKCKIDDVHKNLALLRKHDLKAFMNIILTTPGATVDDVEETVDWAMYYIKDGYYSAGINMACVPLKGSNFFERYSDFLTGVEPIPNTRYYVKRDLMVYAADPHVKELQKTYYHGIEDYCNRIAETEGIVHRTSSNMAMIKLSYMKLLITQIRKKYDLPSNFSETEKSFRLLAGLDTEHNPDAYREWFAGFYEDGGIDDAGAQLLSEYEDSVLIKKGAVAYQ